MGFLIVLVLFKALVQIKNSIYKRCPLAFLISQPLVPTVTLLHPDLCTCYCLPLLPSVQVFYKCESQIRTMWTVFIAVVDGGSS